MSQPTFLWVVPTRHNTRLKIASLDCNTEMALPATNTTIFTYTIIITVGSFPLPLINKKCEERSLRSIHHRPPGYSGCLKGRKRRDIILSESEGSGRRKKTCQRWSLYRFSTCVFIKNTELKKIKFSFSFPIFNITEEEKRQEGR